MVWGYEGLRTNFLVHRDLLKGTYVVGGLTSWLLMLKRCTESYFQNWKWTHRKQHNAWGFHGVFRGQQNPSMINSSSKFSVKSSSDSKMPFKEIVLQKGNIQFLLSYLLSVGMAKWFHSLTCGHKVTYLDPCQIAVYEVVRKVTPLCNFQKNSCSVWFYCR